MARTKITIVGLGLVGRAIGMGLSEGSRNYDLVGHDKEPKAASAARKAKAVDSTEWNLISACEGAGVIILALPVEAIRDTLQAIEAYLQPGALVMDTASLKRPVLKWADDILPDTVHFVGGDPVIAADGRGADEASADLLQGALYCLCPSPKATPEAVRLASGIVERLGAQPYFLDAAEHDGLMAAVDHLPALLAAALLRSTTGSASWRDMRKLAGTQYESSSRFASDTPAVLRDACLHNSENLVRWIDILTQELQEWKGIIAARDAEQLSEAFEGAVAARLQWLQKRASGQWDDQDRPQTPQPPGFLHSLFGLGGRSRS